MAPHDNVTTLEVATADDRVDGPYLSDRRKDGTCEIWNMVAPGIPCPACNDTFADRLLRAG